MPVVLLLFRAHRVRTCASIYAHTAHASVVCLSFYSGKSFDVIGHVNMDLDRHTRENIEKNWL